MLQYLTDRFFVARRVLMERQAQRNMKRNAALWQALELYLSRTKSTGCNIGDYWALYAEVRRHKPTEVLECGTGVSTLVIAHALRENAEETGRAGRVTSMEEVAEYLDMARDLMPTEYAPLVDFHHSERVDDAFALFRGVRYADVPERDYDFVFVDGPNYVSPTDNCPTFDFDYLHVLRRSQTPVRAMIDKRVSTCFALQQILGRDKVRYDPVRHLGFVAPCTRKDLGILPEKMWSANFSDSFRPFGPTRLYMAPCHEAPRPRQAS